MYLFTKGDRRFDELRPEMETVINKLNCQITAYSELPAFLTPEGGLNSGFMIAHCTAAALGMWTKLYVYQLSENQGNTDNIMVKTQTEIHITVKYIVKIGSSRCLLF